MEPAAPSQDRSLPEVETPAAAPDAGLVPIPAPTPGSLFRTRNYRLLWLGETVSVLGDQVHFIALTWLVLQLTGNGLAVGGVLAVSGIPRAVLMLVGGALTDRYSPRTVMLASNLLRMVLVGLLAILTLSGAVRLWQIYALALIFGAVDAFFFPAASSIMPQVAERDQLELANGLMQGTVQVTQLAGPLLGGFLIALAGGRAAGADPSAPPELTGIGLAFGFDALTFLVSCLTLWWLRLPPPAAASTAGQNILAQIRAGLAAVWGSVVMRTVFLISAAINFLLVGPFTVGVPVLADGRLAAPGIAEGAAAFGLVMSANGGGMLVGTLLAALLPRPAPRRLGPTILALAAGMGLGLAGIGLARALWAAALFSAGMGLANGYVHVLFFTWLQRRTPADRLGRVMSFMMFASVGLAPLSLALAGALVDLAVVPLFVTAGALLALITLWAATIAPVRAMGLTPAEPEHD